MMRRAALLFILALALSGCSVAPRTYDDFAKCLTDKGVTMYGSFWCTHCQNQKSMFGSSFKFVTYVDCDKNRDDCLEVGIEGYPAWIIAAKKHYGEQSLDKLAELSGCALA